MTIRQQSTIAVSGIAGSFSEAAAFEFARRSSIEPKVDYLVSAPGVFRAASRSAASYGVVPLCNILGGPVLETVAAMSQHTFCVADVLSMRIEQYLFALPGETKGDILAIVSHPQALAQCRNYLAKKFPDAVLQEYADTALAAEDLAKGRLLRTTAIIASKEAGDTFGLEVLAGPINDDPENYTTFLLLTNVRELVISQPLTEREL